MTDHLVDPDKVFIDGEGSAPDQEQLLALALDMALQIKSYVNIAEDHNLTLDQLQNIVVTNVYFREVYKSLRLHINDIPEDQLVLKQAELFAMELMPHMSRMARSKDTPENVASAIFKTFMGAATTNVKSNTQGVFSGANVSIKYAPDERLTRLPKVVN